MKVTVKEQKSCEIPFDEILIGYVYEVDDGAVLFKVDGNNAVIFKGFGGYDYLGLACGYKAFPAIKILGKLTEIIVEEV